MQVQPLSNGTLTISFLPKYDNVADKGMKVLSPLVITGTPEELDAGFLSVIEKGVAASTGLTQTLAAFEASVAKAREESDMAETLKRQEKKKLESEKKERESATNKLKEAIKTAASQKPEEVIKSLESALKRYDMADAEVVTEAEQIVVGFKKEIATPNLFS